MRDLTIRDFDGEARMRDLDIAEALEFEQPRDIRKLIQRNMDDILTFGDCATVGRSARHGGAPFIEYWLNEEQALFLCTRSEARGAVALTKEMVMIFAAWRRGQLPGPAPRDVLDLPEDAHVWRGLVREARLLFGRDRARWLWQRSPLPQMPDFVDETGAELEGASAVVAQFIEACCTVTGAQEDFVTSRALLDAFALWAAPLGHAMGERTVSRALRDVSRGYRCPVTGRGFAAHKRSVSGYIGLRLAARPALSPHPE